eukprot:1178202-Prorocentrum_minimum.AAC.1
MLTHLACDFKQVSLELAVQVPVGGHPGSTQLKALHLLKSIFYSHGPSKTLLLQVDTLVNNASSASKKHTLSMVPG